MIYTCSYHNKRKIVYVKKIILEFYLFYLSLLWWRVVHQTNSYKIKLRKRKLVLAVSPDYAPFEFKALVNGKDKVVGADIELAQAIADELHVKLEVSPMSFDNVLSSLQTGKADMAISGLSYTKERAKVYDFSKPYYTTENAVLVRKSDLGKYTNRKP